MDSVKNYKLLTHPNYDRALQRLKKKHSSVLTYLGKQAAKILKEPALGKPLGNILKNRRRVHVGSFVLIYEIREN